MSDVITLSIAKESQPKLQGTQNGWFQWLLSDNRLNRIEYVDTIKSLLERHQAAQKMGIDHVVVVESGQSDFLQALNAEDRDNLKVIFRNRCPSDVVNLLCQPDAEILEAWEKVCQGKNNKPADQLVQNRALAKAYGNSFNQWLNTLHKDDLTDYLPKPKRFFLPSEFTYVGIEEGALVFALSAFPGAWLSISRQSGRKLKVKYTGFIKAPTLKLSRWGIQRDWNTLDDPFLAKWLKNCRVPPKELKAVGLEPDKPFNWLNQLLSKVVKPWKDIMNNGLGILQRPRVLGPVLATIAVVAVSLWFIIQHLQHPIIPEIEPGYQVALQKEMIPNREQAFITDSLGFSGTGLPFVSFTEGYKGGIARLSKNDYQPDSQADKEFLRLGEWVALLDAGCSHNAKLDSAFWQQQQTIAKALIDAFDKHDSPKAKTVVGVLDNMDNALTEKLSGNKTNTALCHDLKGFSVQMAFGLQSINLVVSGMRK
ncbi:MAG: hypothetical protein DRR19_13055 [Candidatus Parabeggiatoa sp. nov. 1]|nr:MAG: hypothetical protein DRR19_13055 [Gammaproteobacteria bacterium]